jgi:hypothetical protein
MPKVYGFNNGGNPGFMSAVAIAEDGTFLASHCCSSESFMPHDLGVDGESEWHHKAYREHYPDGFETEFVSYDSVDTHEGLQLAFKRARERTKEKDAKDVRYA